MTYILTYLLNLFDLAMTNQLVLFYGIEIEANPFGRWLYQSGFVTPFKIFGVGAALIFLHYGIKKYPRWKWTSWLVLATYIGLAAYHVVIAAKLYL